MKINKIAALILSLCLMSFGLMGLGLCLPALGEGLPAQYVGAWDVVEAGTETLGSIVVIYEDSRMEWFQAEGEAVALVSEGRLSLTEDEDGLFFMYYDAPVYYAQRFAQREGWMDLVDNGGNTTSWFNATPDDVINEGLEKDPKNPIVGLWSQMTDETTFATLEMYDDGVFAFADLADSGADTLGMYDLTCGLLSLYGQEHLLGYGEMDGELLELFNGGAGMTLKKRESAAFIPTQAELLGSWESADKDRAYTFAKNGQVEDMGVDTRYALKGSRLIMYLPDMNVSVVSAAILNPDGTLTLTNLKTNDLAITLTKVK